MILIDWDKLSPEGITDILHTYSRGRSGTALQSCVMSLNLPNSCLQGIVLTISTHSGPQVVYHYPPADLTSGNRTSKRNSKFARDKSNMTGSMFSLHSQSHLGTPRKRSQRFHQDAESEANVSITSARTDRVDSDAYSSSDDDTSTGLSDGDISTDYADVSSSSSSSGSDEESEETTGTRLSIDNDASLRSQGTSSKSASRGTQVSATKVFHFLNTDDSKRTASAPKHSSGRGPEIANVDQSNLDSASDDDSDSMYELDDDHFGAEFQDINKILRFDADFYAEISSPPKELCNTRFELTIDDLALVGLPIHKDAGGQWRKSKKKKSTNRSRRSNSSSRGRTASVSFLETTNADCEPPTHEDTNVSSLVENQIGRDDYHDLEKSVNMFHLSFLVNPGLVEYNKRVDDIYHYVISRLSLVLRYTQHKNGYVTKECYEILKEQDRVLKSSERYKTIKGAGNKGKYLYQRIIQKSSLARAITKCFDAISRNEVANLEIDHNKILSLQIPLTNEFDILPDLKTNPVLKGSFLTTIQNKKFLEQNTDSINDGWKQEKDDNDDLLDYALLLLHEPAHIIQELQESSFQNDMASVILTSLVKHAKPTVPLRNYQYLIDEVIGGLASSENDPTKRNTLQMGMLRSFALHLMYWRHARVIIPISSKNTYIVSPLAPISGYPTNDLNDANSKPLIYRNQEKFSKKFPSLPPLPSFLGRISSYKPRAFGSIIPSKDHKSIYLSALTWLIRHGYVTQLLTFAWVRVDSRIKIAVDEDLEIDGIKKPKHLRYQNLNTTTNDNILARGDLVPSAAEDYLDLYYYGGDEDIVNNSDFTIILNPETATAVEKRWLYKCVEGQPPEIQNLFHKLVKYMNGKTPIELVQLREGVTKYEIKKLFQALGKYLVEVNHW